MGQNEEVPLHPGVAQKADAIARAICKGYRDISAIAKATHLSETTVIRVAALLRDRGRIEVLRSGEVELVPAVPR